MKTIYRSEVLNKDFDTVAELEAAETKFNEEHAKELALKAERAKAAKEVEEAYKVANEAMEAANTKLREFCKKYGSFHTTVTEPRTLFSSLFDNFWF